LSNQPFVSYALFGSTLLTTNSVLENIIACCHFERNIFHGFQVWHKNTQTSLFFVNYVSFVSGGYKLMPFVLSRRSRLVPWGKPAHFQMRSNCPRATEAQITGMWGLLTVACNIRGRN